MSFYPDLGTATMIVSGPRIRAIGWLDDRHPFPRGPSTDAFRSALQKVVSWDTVGQLFPNELERATGSFCGLHTCELCHKFRSGRNAVVPGNQLIYVCPAMIRHYVEEHAYAPPEQFVSAVIATASAELDSSGQELRRIFALQKAELERAARARPAMEATVYTVDWVKCPYCGFRFKVTDESFFRNETHLRCGQRLIIK